MKKYVCTITFLKKDPNKENHLIGWVKCVSESRNKFPKKATIDFDDPDIWLEATKPVEGRDGDEWLVVWDVRRKGPGPRVHKARFYRPGEDEALLLQKGNEPRSEQRKHASST